MDGVAKPLSVSRFPLRAKPCSFEVLQNIRDKTYILHGYI